MECSLCSKHFGRKYNLVRHLKNVHGVDEIPSDGKERNHVCKICNQKFTEHRSLQHHLKHQHDTDDSSHLPKVVPFDLTVHENGGTYLCSICNRPFNTREARDHHFINNHQVGSYKCRHCSKCFARAINKRYHERICPSHRETKHSSPCSLLESAVSQPTTIPNTPLASPTSQPSDSPISSVYRQSSNIISPPSSPLTLSPVSPLQLPTTTPTRSHQSTNIISPPSSLLTSSPVTHIQSPTSTPTTSQYGGGGEHNAFENSDDVDDDGTMQLHRTGFDSTFQIYRKKYQPQAANIIDRIKNGVNEAQHRVRLLQESNISYKIYLSIQVSFYRASNTEEITSPHPTFNSDIAIVIPTTPLTHIFKVLYDNIMHQIDTFEQNGRGWVVHQLVYLDLHASQYDSLHASSYMKMPKKYHKKVAI